MSLTILPSHLLIIAALYLLWHYRATLLRASYWYRARRLHARLEAEARCRIVCIVGNVMDESALRWTSKIRAAQRSGLELHLLIHTNGGASHAATRVKHALIEHPHDVVAHVPSYAWSAGTSIAATCDRIVMGPDSVLGPFDRGSAPSETMMAVDEVRAAREGVSVRLVEARRMVDESTAELVEYRGRRRALRDRLGLNRRRSRPVISDEQMAETLVRGGWGSHWRPIFRNDARIIGLEVVDASARGLEQFSELARLTMLSLPEEQR